MAISLLDWSAVNNGKISFKDSIKNDENVNPIVSAYTKLINDICNNMKQKDLENESNFDTLKNLYATTPQGVDFIEAFQGQISFVPSNFYSANALTNLSGISMTNKIINPIGLYSVGTNKLNNGSAIFDTSRYELRYAIRLNDYYLNEEKTEVSLNSCYAYDYDSSGIFCELKSYGDSNLGELKDFYYKNSDMVNNAILNDSINWCSINKDSIIPYLFDKQTGTATAITTSNTPYANPCITFKSDGVLTYNNNVKTVVNGDWFINVPLFSIFQSSYSGYNYTYTLNNMGLLKGVIKEDEFIARCSKRGYSYYSQSSSFPIIKKEALIRYLNIIGIPFKLFDVDDTITAEEMATNPDEWTDYDSNYKYVDPEGPPKGQPDNEAGGGDGTGDNTEDNFEMPAPTINPATAAVNQYVLNSNQVMSFLSDLFNSTFWTNSDLLNKNPKESVVSLTAWPINLLNWDLNHVGLSQSIQCGNVTMEYAKGQAILNGYNKVLEIGEYEIKPYFGTFMDYLTKIEIFLPFIGWRTLSTQNVMGRTIKVKYVLNFEDGGIVVYITSTDGEIERLEQVEQAKLAFDLPIFTSNINEKEKEKLQLLMTAAVSAATAGFGALGSGVGNVAATTAATAGKEVASGASKINSFQNHINGGNVVASNATWYLPNKCILKFTRPRKSTPSGYARVNGYPANYTAKLGDVTGYTEVDNPVINGIECTENERAQIKALLQGGIYL